MPALRSARALAIASTLAIACGPDVTTPLECDRDNPTKLLSLAGVEPSEWAISPQTIHDDRGWLVVVEGRGLALECDAVPREFGTELHSGLEYFSDADTPWVGRPPPFELPERWFVLDPWGDRPQFETTSTSPIAVLDGALVWGTDSFREEGVPALWTTPLGDDGALSQVPVPYEPGGNLGTVEGWVVYSQPSSAVVEEGSPVFARVGTTDGSGNVSVAIDLRTGETEVLGGGRISLFGGVVSGGRFVVLWPSEDGGQMLLVDRDADRTLPLGEPGWRPEVRSDPSIVYAHNLADPSLARTHLVFLPGLEEAWLDGWFETWPAWVSDNGRRVLDSEDGLHVIAPGESVATPLYPTRGEGCVVGDDLYLWDQGLSQPGGTGVGPSDRVVRIPLDGSPVEVVIEGPLQQARALVDGRWAILREPEDGDLLIYDPRTGAETVVARHVETLLWDHRLQDFGAPCPSWLNVGDPHEEVRFIALDPYGDRALWRYR